jgi:hypothetical protein
VETPEKVEDLAKTNYKKAVEIEEYQPFLVP